MFTYSRTTGGENKVHCKQKSRHKQNARKRNEKTEEKKKRLLDTVTYIL